MQGLPVQCDHCTRNDWLRDAGATSAGQHQIASSEMKNTRLRGPLLVWFGPSGATLLELEIFRGPKTPEQEGARDYVSLNGGGLQKPHQQEISGLAILALVAPCLLTLTLFLGGSLYGLHLIIKVGSFVP